MGYSENTMDIIEKAREGDNRAFTAIMERYQPTMTWVIAKRITNTLDVEDLVMKSFADAFTKLHLYTPSHAFSTWLFRIAVNNTTDFIRGQRATFISMEDRVIPIGLYPSPEDDIIEAETRAAVSKRIQKLKPRYRNVIERRIEGWSFDDIAREYGMNPVTARGAFIRGRSQLKRLFKTNKNN